MEGVNKATSTRPNPEPYWDEDLNVPTPNYPAKYMLCRVRLYRDGSGNTVALVTELARNPGASVTNVAEHVWKSLTRLLRTDRFTMVEHYDGGSYQDRAGNETFEQVWVEHGRPSWKHLGAEGFRELLG